ncbi:MAG: hypothetical protein U0638_05525 [Phycisphaerales bacterium]
MTEQQNSFDSSVGDTARRRETAQTDQFGLTADAQKIRDALMHDIERGRRLGVNLETAEAIVAKHLDGLDDSTRRSVLRSLVDQLRVR